MTDTVKTGGGGEGNVFKEKKYLVLLKDLSSLCGKKRKQNGVGETNK